MHRLFILRSCTVASHYGRHFSTVFTLHHTGNSTNVCLSALRANHMSRTPPRWYLPFVHNHPARNSRVPAFPSRPHHFITFFTRLSSTPYSWLPPELRTTLYWYNKDRRLPSFYFIFKCFSFELHKNGPNNICLPLASINIDSSCGSSVSSTEFPFPQRQRIPFVSINQPSYFE